MMPQNEKATHVALILTVMCWGLNATVVKKLTQTVDLSLALALRTFIGTAFLLLLVPFTRMLWPRWNARTAIFMLFGGVVYIYLQLILFAEGLSRSTATNAALIMATGPFLAALLERVLFGKPIVARQALGIALALGGIALVVINRAGARLGAASWGDLLLFASVLVFALGGAVIQKMSTGASSLAISLLNHLVASLVFIVHLEVTKDQPWGAIASIHGFSWGLICYFAILAGGLGTLAWGYGIARLGMARAATYQSWIPIFGLMFGALLLGESLSIWHGVGVLGVFAGTYLSFQLTARPIKISS